MITSLPHIFKAAELLRQGQLEPLQLVEYCLERIGQFDGQVRAWVLVDAEGARRQAEERGRLLRQGRPRGWLHGIPIAIKDIIDVQGLPTKAGSPLRAEHVAARDAPLVARLRQQGAILLGKTVTTQYACFDPSPTRNPWNPAHTPGGSSSGSAAAVALEMCMASIGTQTGGSILRPASYCGVAGLKPTFGNVELQGVVPVSARLDHAGPLARSVSDLWALFAALRSDGGRELPELDAALSPPTLSVVGEFFQEQAEAPVRQVTQSALERLRAAGVALETLRLPASFAEVLTMHRRIMAVEAAQIHRREYAECRAAYGPCVASLIDEGLATSAADFAAAREHQQRFGSELQTLLGGQRIAVMPTTATPAPATLETTGDPSFNSPWSYAGVPAVTIPCGLAPDGMPCGLQLVGPAEGEFELLRAAAWCERQLGFDNRPPLLL